MSRETYTPEPRIGLTRREFLRFSGAVFAGSAIVFIDGNRRIADSNEQATRDHGESQFNSSAAGRRVSQIGRRDIQNPNVSDETILDDFSQLQDAARRITEREKIRTEAIDDDPNHTVGQIEYGLGATVAIASLAMVGIGAIGASDGFKKSGS